VPGEALPRHAICHGIANFHNAYELVTLGGSVYPLINVTSANGEIWRIANLVATETLELSLVTSQDRPLPIQLIAVNGVSVTAAPGASPTGVTYVNGVRLATAPCTGGFATQGSLCVSLMDLMPGTRVEVWVTPNDLVAGETPVVVLRRFPTLTGPIGDDWPGMDLAVVDFTAAVAAVDSHASVGSVSRAASGDLVVASLAGAAAAPADAAAVLSSSPSPPLPQSWTPGTCGLPAGYSRRVYVGNPDGTQTEVFGMAYEVLDASGAVVPGSEQNLTFYAPTEGFICALQNTTERWAVVNVAQEEHVFHIHQTQFYVQPNDTIATGESFPFSVMSATEAVDSVALPYSDGFCGVNQIEGFKSGACVPYPIVIRVPFLVQGPFVAHCHMGEHNDGGMMIGVRVVASGAPPRGMLAGVVVALVTGALGAAAAGG